MQLARQPGQRDINYRHAPAHCCGSIDGSAALSRCQRVKNPALAIRLPSTQSPKRRVLSSLREATRPPGSWPAQSWTSRKSGRGRVRYRTSLISKPTGRPSREGAGGPLLSRVPHAHTTCRRRSQDSPVSVLGALQGRQCDACAQAVGHISQVARTAQGVDGRA